MTMRLSMSSFAGTARTEVAVGTSSEDSMLVTTRALAPRMGVCVASLSGPDALGASASRGLGVMDAAGSGRVLGVSLAVGAGAGAAVAGGGRRPRRAVRARRPEPAGGWPARARGRRPGSGPWPGRGRGRGRGAGAVGRAGGRRGGRPARGGGRVAAQGTLTRRVVLEEVPPRAVDAVAVLLVLLVQLVDQPLVGSEGGQGVAGRGLLGHGGCASFSAGRCRGVGTRSSLSPLLARHAVGRASGARAATAGMPCSRHTGRRHRRPPVAPAEGVDVS